MKGKIFLTLILTLLGCFPAYARVALEPESFKRVRIAEVYNPSAAQLLIMRFNASLRNIGAAPPVWQTLPAETVSDVEKLGDIMSIGYYDMIITGDDDYAKNLESRDLLKQLAPIWKERLVLIGPEDRRAKMEGLSAPEIMSRISVQNELFFSLLIDGFVRKKEDELWALASAIELGENRGYVETSRDVISALMQAGDEGGFVLVGEGSFAQYVESERYEPALVKIADTDCFRVTYVCLMSDTGFRRNRADDAAKYAEWFQGPDAAEIIAGFRVGGTNPFIPAGSQ